MIPESIKQHRPKGTEIQAKGGHYYVYRVQGYYDKEAKKSKRRSLGCIGQIYEGIGLVPNSKEAATAPDCTKEYGATRIAMAATEPLFETLRECFPGDFLRIYTMAVLKLLGNLSARDIGTAYQRSAISEILPKVYVSKNTVSAFLNGLSSKRGSMLEFMRRFTDFKGDTILFDGSSFLSGSKENPFVDKGYCPGKRGRTQIRLIYAFNQSTKTPVYFRVLPGNVGDMASFEACISEMGRAEGCLAILDKGFQSQANILTMQRNGISFIMPLRKDTKEAQGARIGPGTVERGEAEFFEYHHRIVCLIQ